MMIWAKLRYNVSMIFITRLLVIIVTFFPAGSTFANSPSPGKPEPLEITIHYLLNYVTNSDKIFIRNNQKYSGSEAAGHMQKKYAHYQDKIKTPEDFIELAATKSLISGKPYLVIVDNNKVLTAQWLLDVLTEYRHQNLSNRQQKSQ